MFSMVLPATWQAPSSLASDIAAGKSLWSTAALMTPGGPIRARCADCHAQDGRDLKYFNYSNNSIRVRSMFHGLTQQQGDQIASYIRSLNAPAPASARPWNPAYQPGPGLDAGPAVNWSAGAGLDAVLDRDVDMLNYLAPSGNTSSWAADRNISARDMPLAFPLPDWNKWLPRIHPLDAWGDLFTVSYSPNAYIRLRSNLVRGDANVYLKNKPDFGWLTDASFLIPLTPEPGSPLWTASMVDKMYSTRLWIMVKQWELNQEFQLEDLGRAVHGPQAETRAWVGGAPFMVSPNMLHIPPGAAGLGNGSVKNWYYLAFAWYQSQLILNYSYYTPQGRPIDWPYAQGMINQLGANTSAPQASLLLLWMVKALQISQLDGGPELGSAGWNPGINTPVYFAYPDFNRLWGEYTASQRATYTQAYVEQWFAKIRTFTPQQFYLGGMVSPTEVPTLSYTGSVGSQLNYSIPQLNFFGVSSSLVSQIADWAKTLWPLGSWDAAKSSTCYYSQGRGLVICSTYGPNY